MSDSSTEADKGKIAGRRDYIAAQVAATLHQMGGAALTLLDSRAASEEGSCMDPARFPHAPDLLAPDSQISCGKTQ